MLAWVGGSMAYVKKKNPANNGGRPKKIIDYATLDKLCAIQCTGEEIAAILGLSYESLNNKLKQEKKMGFLEYFKQKGSTGKASLRRRQFTMAESNPTMAIWLGKQYLGQKDQSHSSIEATVRNQYDEMSDKDIEKELRRYDEKAKD